MAIKKIKNKEFFGLESNFMIEKSRDYFVKSVKVTQIAYLSYENFKDSFNNFPKDYVKLFYSLFINFF